MGVGHRHEPPRVARLPRRPQKRPGPSELRLVRLVPKLPVPKLPVPKLPVPKSPVPKSRVPKSPVRKLPVRRRSPVQGGDRGPRPVRPLRCQAGFVRMFLRLGLVDCHPAGRPAVRRRSRRPEANRS